MLPFYQKLAAYTLYHVLPKVCRTWVIIQKRSPLLYLSRFILVLLLLFYSRALIQVPTKACRSFLPHPTLQIIWHSLKKRSASRNQTYWKKKILLLICSGRLTIKIPDKGIKAYVWEHEHVQQYFVIHDQRPVWAFSCRKLHSTCWCHCKVASKLSIFCCCMW